MFGRSTKVFLIVFVIAASFFLLFNYYLPSKIGAAGSKWSQTNRVKHRVTAETVEIAPQETKSIAAKLGIPKPKTVTYNKFDPNGIKKQKKKIQKIFQIPEEIEPEVNFWRDIYTKYDKTKVVFHDKKYLNIVYSVIDLSDVVDNPRLTEEEQIAIKKKRVDAELNRIAGILETLDDKDPDTLSPEEKRIRDLFAEVSEKDKFKKAAESDRLRSQTGIREKFIKGIRIAGRYLGEMEKIFSEYGVPLEITRLAFVESMFNLDALSKVGASGIWQFMTSSGRLFMTINQIVDERNDPIIATHGAAKHLMRDYEILNSWPLAINSYNTGRGRIEKAVAKMKTKDISKIIKKFDYPGYKFASRNFYPAFLAALTAFENREQYFGKIEMDEPLKFDQIKTPFFATLPELSKYTGVTLENLVSLNPHLQNDVLEGSLPVPVGFDFKVPEGLGENFLVAMSEINNSAKYAKWHITEPGENLKTVAVKYKTNSAVLKNLNGLRHAQIKPGQILKLPKTLELAKD